MVVAGETDGVNVMVAPRRTFKAACVSVGKHTLVTVQPYGRSRSATSRITVLRRHSKESESICRANNYMLPARG